MTKPVSRKPSRKTWRRHLSWRRSLIAVVAAIGFVSGAVIVSYYNDFSSLIDARLSGERERTLPRVFARPMELRQGQALNQPEVIARLNALGYAQREVPTERGEFTVERDALLVMPRGGDHDAQLVRVSFASMEPDAEVAPRGIRRLAIADGDPVRSVGFDSPLLTALMTSGDREKRRRVPLDSMPLHMQQAVLAVEDQSFYSHPGINPVRLASAAYTNWFGDRSQLVGNSTVTQQLARMFFLADEFNAELTAGQRSYARKLREVIMSLVLERLASKEEILELYLNDVYLGQRGSFAIHGVAEAARLFFGKDVANLTISEAALIAGVIQNPGLRSPFANPERSVERRNLVIRAMASETFISDVEAERALQEPLEVVARAVDNEAPYFVDMVSAEVDETFPGVTAETGRVDVFTTLDINLQRAALDAVRNGIASVDAALTRLENLGRAQAALIAVDPRTGEILAMVGGRTYNASQFNRATVARRQPGSVFKPFVYLAGFETATEEQRTDLTPASLTLDEPNMFVYDEEIWEPANYDAYDGAITWRRALMLSRNLATIHVGETIGFDAVARFWRRVGVGEPPLAVPAITLGVFELTPLEVAQAYTLFLNEGAVRPLQSINRIETDNGELRPRETELIPVASPQNAFLVTNMLRSVITEGTGARVRASGFTLDAAGKTGTTNELRDAWFVGFTPELLTVVWVGLDDNQPLELTGSQAAVPIWIEFMKTALAGRPNQRFEVPDGIVFADIDSDTGQLALPWCPLTRTEAFVEGTEPLGYCELHRW